MPDATIFIVDQVVVRPGRASEFIGAYLAEYAPSAHERGLTLDRVLVSPPAWIDGVNNTVTATWTVSGPGDWWAAAVRGRHDPEPARWWKSVEPLIVERTRSMAASVDDVEKLNDV